MSNPNNQLSPRKIERLIQAHKSGEKIDLDAVQKYTQIQSPIYLTLYLEAFRKEAGIATDAEATGSTGSANVDTSETESVNRPAVTSSAVAKKSFVLLDSQGVESELDVIRETPSTVVLRKPEPEIVKLIVKGRTIDVDLTLLRKMPTAATHQGVKVSALLAAAEIA